MSFLHYQKTPSQQRTPKRSIDILSPKMDQAANFPSEKNLKILFNSSQNRPIN